MQKARLPVEPGMLEQLIGESDELIRIFAASIRTARTNATEKMVREEKEFYGEAGAD